MVLAPARRARGRRRRFCWARRGRRGRAGPCWAASMLQCKQPSPCLRSRTTALLICRPLPRLPTRPPAPAVRWVDLTGLEHEVVGRDFKFSSYKKVRKLQKGVGVGGRGGEGMRAVGGRDDSSVYGSHRPFAVHPPALGGTPRVPDPLSPPRAAGLCATLPPSAPPAAAGAPAQVHPRRLRGRANVHRGAQQVRHPER